ncbi:hypothetical protein [uncultured Prochlorococcus sp.]|uniref:hypothetical protein n=1 Tax=uncultured Prochlorococcus sp. TaxID=159733 RepID=UPI0025868975|nr:hypothetical protein [uncultured Prochlorococcus sp.]
MNKKTIRIEKEIEIFNYFLRQRNFDYFYDLISRTLILNNYSELNKKYLIFCIYELDDFFLNKQLQILLYCCFDIEITLYLIKENKYKILEKNNSNGFKLIELNKENKNFNGEQNISLFSCDLLISREVLINIFKESDLSKFVQATNNIYILPISYLLNKFSLNSDLFDLHQSSRSEKNLDKKNPKNIIETAESQLSKPSDKKIYIIWPKDEFKTKLLYKTFNKEDSLEDIIPNSIIRDYEQTALLVDKEQFNHISDQSIYKEFKFHLKPNQIKPKHLHAYFNHGGGGNNVIEAIVKSLDLKFSFAEDFEDLRDGIPVVWGVLRNSKSIIDYAKKIGQYFYYIDHAYFNRGHKSSYRITRNYFEAGPVKKCPNDRLKKLDIPLQDWKKGGQKILVCPPTEYFQEAHVAHNWLVDTLNTLKQHTDRKIVIRRKPKPGSNIKPLNEALKEAFALVTHSSNVAVEAVIAGVPVFVANSSACEPVGITDFSRIESPIYPNREPWLAHLAYSQFSYEEIESGKFFEIMRDYEDFDFI